MVALTLTADFARLQRKLGWMALLLESREVRERLGSGLIDRLLEALSGGGCDELCKLGPVAANGAGNLMVNVESAGILDEVSTALRALGFEFHDAPFKEIDTTLLESHSAEFAFKPAQEPLTAREQYLAQYIVDKLQRAGRI